MQKEELTGQKCRAHRTVMHINFILSLFLPPSSLFQDPDFSAMGYIVNSYTINSCVRLPFLESREDNPKKIPVLAVSNKGK